MEDGAPHEEPEGRRLHGFTAEVAPKLFLTLVAALVTALLIPWVTGRWQDHKQQLELRTTLAGDMSRAYTSVIVSGRFVTGGLVYSGSTERAQQVAASELAWTTALHDWLVESATVGAQLTGRYGPHGVTAEWRSFALAVTRYMRLGSQVPAAERAQLLADERGYVGDDGVGWDGLHVPKRFKDHPEFRASYAQLGEALIARGDALVEQELTLHPRV
jgi:hypothetical protein